MSQLTISLIILVLTIAAFLSGKIPFTVIAVAIMVSLIQTGILTVGEAFGALTNKTIIMIAAMFVVSAGISRSGILDSTKALVLRYKDKRKMVFFVLMFVGMLLSVLSSAVSSLVVLLPLIYSVANDLEVSRSKLIYPIAAVAQVTTASTILGQGPLNMNWSEVMMSLGAPTPFNIWDFTIARIPFALAAFIIGIVYMPKVLPDIPNSEFADGGASGGAISNLPASKKNIAKVICGVAIVAMLILDYFAIVPMYIIALVACILLVLTGVMSEKEAISSIHAPTIFMSVGVLALSTALNKTGAAEVVADILIKMLGGTTNPYIIMGVFFTVPLILTQFMNNAATIAIFAPLIASVAISLGVDPRAGVMGVIIAGTSAFMTPMACNMMAMVHGVGGYSMKDYLKAGTPLFIIDILLAVFFLPLLFPF